MHKGLEKFVLEWIYHEVENLGSLLLLGKILNPIYFNLMEYI